MPNYCEVRIPSECVNLYLTPAHSLDREDIKTIEQFFEICWACTKCHFYIDRKISKEERLAIVKGIIERRDAYSD